MSDISSIQAALAAVSSAVNIAKNLATADSKMEIAALKMQIAELMEALAEAKLALIDADTNAKELESKASGNDELSLIRKDLEFRENVYFWPNPPQGRHEGPYCPTCLDRDHKLLALAKTPPLFDDLVKYQCQGCKGNY